VMRILEKIPNVHLIAPLDYLSFVRLMQRAHVILTDSGGVQEEAPSLGKPVLVLRDVTERPEAIAAGTVELVGTETGRIIDAVNNLYDDQEKYDEVAQASNPYGDGLACERVIAALTGAKVAEFKPAYLTKLAKQAA
jgi:UDP-N-acetylglucosamine 2-epimerase (non-hydrolysing)